jgi:ribonucleoside-triphosphate reductase
MDYFDNAYQSVIYKTRYSKWKEEENRREDWNETVDRYVEFLFGKVKDRHGYDDEDMKEEVRQAILTRKVMPSMRLLMSAGPAAERSEIAAYNCAYIAIDDLIAFDEMLYVLMNGTGVGFSVELNEVNKLPDVPSHFLTNQDKFVVADSKEGWSEVTRHVVLSLFDGKIPDWDTSLVRPEGARLKTFGGRASGPAPLNELLNFIVKTVVDAAGRKLTPLECHEISCKVGEIVVVGGVRRAALISLSDLSSDTMRDAKSGEWWVDRPHLRLANNSAVYESKPTEEVFWEEWTALRNSGSGERGMFNRGAARKRIESIGRKMDNIGMNPCGEILLNSRQFCNLTSAIIRPDMTKEELRYAVYMETVLGTLQSCLTNFPYLSDKWRENTEKERLLGVSLGGVFSHKLMATPSDELEEFLKELNNLSKHTNATLASELGIPASAARTTIKPDGNTGEKNGITSGISPAHSEYYIRTIRAAKSDPVTEFLKFYGVEAEDDVMDPTRTTIFSFPVMAPKGAVTRDELTAVQHLEVVKMYSKNWTDHNPSVTVNVREEEWDEVGQWMYENFDEFVGVSFLPHTDHTYAQAPFQEIGKEEYEELVKKTPSYLPWDALGEFEKENTTTGDQALACVAGGCSITSI